MKAGWEVRQIKDVTFIQEGPGIRKYEYQEDGFPMINVRCVQDGYIDMSSARAANTELATGKWKHFQVDAGDILFTISGTIGRCAIVQESDLPLLMNTSVVRFRPTVPELDSRFLYFFLQSEGFQGPLKSLSSGTAIRNVGPTHIKTLSIPVPPLEEQQQIVAVLDEAFEGLARARANAEANLQNARELFVAVVDSLLTSGESRWVTGSFSDLVGPVSTGPFGSLLHKSDYVEGQTPLVNPANIEAGEIKADMRKTVRADALQRLSAYRLRKRDIVIGRRGEMGRCAVVGESEDGWLCGTGSFIIRSRANVEPGFVAHLLRTPTYVARLESIATGATMANLSNKALGAMPISLPSREQQMELLDQIEVLQLQAENCARRYEQKLDDLAGLSQSLLQKAFSGALT